MHWHVKLFSGNRNNCSRRDCDGSTFISLVWRYNEPGLKDLGVNGVLLPMLDKDISNFLTQHALACEDCSCRKP